MKYCALCSGRIPVKIGVDGKLRNLQSRHYCLTCSPFGSHNTRQLDRLPSADEQARKKLEASQAKYRKYQRKARWERKRLLVAKLGGCCAICGYNRDCSAAYHFHHRDPASKVFDLGTAGLLRRWDEVIAEISKCVLLCCRCHAGVHAGLHKDWELHWGGQVAQTVRAAP